MRNNFWKTLPKPFSVLAPMEDVTDFPFREIMATVLPRPDVLFTEFTSSDGLCSKGRDVTIRKFKYSKAQRPIVAQIWGNKPEHLFKAAQLVEELQFDGVDINMGCPDRAVLKQGSGAALCMNPALAKEIIQAVKEGAPKTALSVKTRIGFKKIITEEWISFLLEQKIEALTVHGRTAAQKSDVPANWDEIAKAVQMRNRVAPDTILIGNGDIKNYHEGKMAHEKYQVDGSMIGRGIFTNPWAFEKIDNPQEHTKKDYIEVLIKHLDLFEQTWEDTKNFAIMKKFFKMYVHNFPEASVIRQKLMESKTSTEIRTILAEEMLVE